MKKIISSVITFVLLLNICTACNFDTKTSEEDIQKQEFPKEIINNKNDLETVKYEYSSDQIKEYHLKLDDIAQNNNVYGMQVVVFKGEDILDSYNYGYSDYYNKIEVNDNTVFRIASTSKMISNMLIMKLVDDGLISLDSKLKESTGLNFDEDVKLYHVLTHTSGVVDSKEFNENMNKVLDINHLLEISSVNKPGKVYCYSNFNAGTMAAIIECVTGEYFMDYAQRELFDYLDLNAAFVCEYLDEETEIAKMYDGEVVDPKTWFYNYDFYRSFELGKQYRLAYGNMYCSASDLAKLGMVLAGNGMLNGKPFLSYNALNEIRTIRNEAIGHNYLTGLNTDYFDNLVNGRIMYGHTGSAYNAISCLIYDPSDNTGVALVTNHSVNRKNDLNYTEVIYDTINLAYKSFFDLINE